MRSATAELERQQGHAHSSGPAARRGNDPGPAGFSVSFDGSVGATHANGSASVPPNTAYGAARARISANSDGRGKDIGDTDAFRYNVDVMRQQAKQRRAAAGSGGSGGARAPSGMGTPRYIDGTQPCPLVGTRSLAFLRAAMGGADEGASDRNGERRGTAVVGGWSQTYVPTRSETLREVAFAAAGAAAAAAGEIGSTIKPIFSGRDEIDTKRLAIKSSCRLAL